MGPEQLKARLVERLIPSANWSPDAVPVRSDWDLNPGLERPSEGLKPAAVLIAIVARPEGATVVMTRRADSLARHTGQIAFAGGRLDPGETATEAALREAWEEVALDPQAVDVLGVGDPYQSGTGFLITPVVGWLEAPPDLKPSPGEVAEVFEVPWAFLMDPANHRQGTIDFKGGTRLYWAIPYEDRNIWGVTAGIVRALRMRLYSDEADPIRAADEDAA